MTRFALLALMAAATSATPNLAATPTAEQALQLRPIQSMAEYQQVDAAGAKSASIKAEKLGEVTGWVVRDENGNALRRFADTNADDVVDQWCYFQNGVETYRDIDSDFNGKADQYRWLNTGGTRWGIDKDEDGRIDSWREISPHELAEMAVRAVQTADAKLFESLLVTADEAQALGLGAELGPVVTEAAESARRDFAKFASEQKVLTPEAKFVDFGAARPSTMPAGSSGLSRDLIAYESVSALVEVAGKSEQVYLNTLLRTENGWRLIRLPQIGSDANPSAQLTIGTANPPLPSSADAPSDEMQKLIDELTALDKQPATGPDRAGQIAAKSRLLLRLAEVSPNNEQRETWIRQLADMLSAEAQTGQYPAGLQELEALEARLTKDGATGDVLAHVEFRRLMASYGQKQQDPKANLATVQGWWLKSLEDFVTKYPSSTNSAEALLQLGMAQEFAGEIDAAQEWYGKLASSFGNTPEGAKAGGAIRRLKSIGQPLVLQGKTLAGQQLDLKGYRGRLVLVQYWASWCQPCKADMAQIKQIYAKYRPKGFEVIGVNLDSNPQGAVAYVQAEKVPWQQLHEAGGLEGRLANEMGVMTLPLMLLVDDKGNVLNRNIGIVEIEAEIKRLLRL